MPGFDQTGPEGNGAMTGRRLGRCTGYGHNMRNPDSPLTDDEILNSDRYFRGRGYGFGWRRFGRGRGRGLGLQNRFRGGF